MYMFRPGSVRFVHVGNSIDILFLTHVLTTFKKPREENPPSIPLTEYTDRVYRPEFLDFIEIQSPDFF